MENNVPVTRTFVNPEQKKQKIKKVPLPAKGTGTSRTFSLFIIS